MLSMVWNDRWRFLDLEEHFAVYKTHHEHPVNVLIHFLCVWPNYFTAHILLYFTPPLLVAEFPSNLLGESPLSPNLGFLVAVFYALVYISVDRRAGYIAASLCILLWVGGSVLASYLGSSLAWKVVLVAQSFCWILMFIGHGVFEGGAPVFLHRTISPVLMAPFFVLLEVSQKIFNYEPYPGFYSSVNAIIEAGQKTGNINKEKNN